MAEDVPTSRGAGWRTHIIRIGAAAIIITACAMPWLLVRAV